MIDWKRRCFELATIVDRHRKERMVTDKQEAWKIAQELIELGKREDKAQTKFMEYWRCADKKKAKVIYNEYLELIRYA